MTDPPLAEIMERHRLLRKAYDTLAKLFSETKHERDAARAEIVRQDAEIERLRMALRRARHELDQWVYADGSGAYRVERAEAIIDAALNEKEPDADA